MMGRLTGSDDNTLKERFSFVYVGAVAYAAGAVLDEPGVDRDSLDVTFASRGQVGPRRSPHFHAQLKCHTGEPDKTGNVAFDLKLKNYRDLIPTNHHVPRILIVLCVPRDLAEHTTWSPEQLLLRRCGYWTHLGGMAEDAPDYNQELTRLLVTLADLERRDSLYVAREIKESVGDVIRFRVVLGSGDSSRLPLALAPTVFKAAHDVTISAANAIRQRRPFYKKWTNEVHDFARQAEVGQTEPAYDTRALRTIFVTRRKRELRSRLSAGSSRSVNERPARHRGRWSSRGGPRESSLRMGG